MLGLRWHGGEMASVAPERFAIQVTNRDSGGMEMEPELRASTDGRVMILALSGRFDSYMAPRVAERLARASEMRSPQVLVNLANVEFLDSTALATLVQSMKHCRQLGGDLRLCCLRQPVRMIFELTRLDKAFEIWASEDEALRAWADKDVD